jgi:alanine-synthesizing transaminase
MIQPARRIANVKYAIRNIAAEAAKVEATGKRVLHCNIGDPLKFDFTTPPHLVDAVVKAMRDGVGNAYAASAGLKTAREAVARDAQRRGLTRVKPEDVFITSGVSEALDLALTALLEPGDEVLLPSPGYPLYNAIAARLGATAVNYHLDEANGWGVDAEELESRVTKRTKAIVFCNPNNPTGGLVAKEQVLKVIEVARKHELALLSDEIYDKLLYGGVHVPTATLADDVPIITFNGLSKAYLAPGWRVGWLMFSNPALTRDVAAAVQRLADARLCGPAAVQFAVEPALFGSQDHIPEMMGRLTRRRDLTVQKLNAIPGVSCVTPQGAFYAMPRLDLPGLQSDEAFVVKLVHQTGVLFVHGEGFGQKEGTHHFRVVFLPKEAVLAEAFDLLKDFIAREAWRS